MPEYVVSPLEQAVDVQQLQQDAYDAVKEVWPDWEPREGNFSTWLITVCARMVGEAIDLAQDVPAEIVKYLGATLFGIQPIAATAATADTTWTITDTDGITIPAGTLVAVPTPDGSTAAFETQGETTIAFGGNTATNIALISLQTGEDMSGLGGVGVEATLISGEGFDNERVGTIMLQGVTQGGNDAELDTDYLDRFSARLTLMAPRPVLARDFALMAVDIAAQQGVSVRAVALDNYDPGPPESFTAEKAVAVAVVDDATGLDVALGIRDAISAALEAYREVNFKVSVLNPNRTTVDVTFTGVAEPGAIPADVEAAAEAAVAEMFNPATWGQPRNNLERSWVNQPYIRRQDISTVLNDVPGFDHWDTLTVGVNGGVQDATETRTMPGVFPLAEPGVIAGSVTA